MNFICPNSKLIFFFFLINFICFPVESKESTTLNTSVSPFISDLPLPPNISEQGLSQLHFDDKGFLYITSSSDVWIYDGINWHKVYAGPDPKVTLLNDGKKLVFSANKLFELFLSPHNHFKLRESEIPVPDYKKSINFHSISGKLLIRTEEDLYSFENERLNHICSFPPTTQFFPTDSVLFLVDGESVEAFEPRTGRITQKKIPETPSLIKSAGEDYLLLSQDRRKISLCELNFKKTKFEIIPGSQITDIQFFGQNKLMILLDDNSLMSVNLKDETTDVFSLNPFGDHFNRLLLSNSERIWAIGDRSIKILDLESAIQILSFNSHFTPDDVEFAGDQMLFLFDNIVYNKLGELVYKGENTIRNIFSTGDVSFVKTDSEIIRVYPETGRRKSFPYALNYLGYGDSGYFLFSSSDSINVMRYAGNDNWESIHSRVKNGEEYCISSSRLCLVANGVLEVFDLKSGKKKFYNIPETFSRQFPVKIIAADDRLWLYNTGHIYSYSFTDNNYRKEDVLFSEGRSIEKLSHPAPGFVLIKFHCYNEPGSFELINTINGSHRFFVIPGLPANYFKYIVKDYDEENFLMGWGEDFFLIKKDIEERTHHSAYPVIYQVITKNDTLLDGMSYDVIKLYNKDLVFTMPYGTRTINLKITHTDFLYPVSFYQYRLNQEEEWSGWISGNFVILENLSPGDYNVSIRTLNSQGEVLNMNTLELSVTRPFFLRWPVIMLLFLILFILAFIFYKRFLLISFRVKKDDSEVRAYHREDVIIPKEASTVSGEKKHSTEREARWDKYDMVTVLFSDIQGFTKIAEQMNPESLIDELDRFFFHFDSVVEKYNIEKIKTIGDAYMAAGGIPRKNRSNPIEVVLAALEMQQYMNNLQKTKVDFWDLRIGIHTGPVIAGVIGHKKRSYDIWGDTVNTASRMESSGEPGRVNISGETYALVKDYFLCEYRGKLPVKYKGNLDMYFVLGLRPELSINLAGIPNRKFFLKLQLLRLMDLEDHVFDRLRRETPETHFFHTPEYAQHLLRYSELLSKAENLDLEETLMVKTAVLLLMTGYIDNYQSPETVSSKLALEILDEFHFSEGQIQNISNLILASKCPPEPITLLEKVMVDIRHEYLGRADFPELCKKLYREQSAYISRLDEAAWKGDTIKLLDNHRFYTAGARRLSEIPFQLQIKRIREDSLDEQL